MSETASSAEASRPPAWAVLPHPLRARGEPAARAWLGERLGLPADALPLSRDARGRPTLGAPLAGWDCNWSHSGPWLLVALGAGLRLGADIESLRPRPRALDLARRWFAPAEADWLAGLPEADRGAAFTRLWCAKEAVLKAHGHGLAFGLDRLVLAPHDGGFTLVDCDARLGAPDAWSLRLFEPAADAVAALAWKPAPHTVAA